MLFRTVFHENTGDSSLFSYYLSIKENKIHQEQILNRL